MPKVSIVMIFYDSSRFMAEALASVASQTFGDWELLLVDDGSSDGSTELARAHAAADPARVRYLEHPGHANRGTSASRNLGLAAARGEYLIRLDSDDVFSSADAIAEQVALLDSRPHVGFVYGAVDYWNTWNGTGGDLIETPSLADSEVAPPELLVRLLGSGADEPVSMMVRRQALLDIGGCDEGIRDYGEDFVLAVKLTSRYRAWVSSRCWYRYRMHPDSYSHRIRAEGGVPRHERALMAWMDPWLRAEGIRDKGVWRAFRKRRNASRHRPVLAWMRRTWDDLDWWLRCGRFRLRLLRRPGGALDRAALAVEPCPVRVAGRDALFVVTLRWTAPAGQLVQLRVGAPDGPSMYQAEGEGRRATGPWAMDRLRFFLQDATHPQPGSPAATLAMTRARIVLEPRRAIETGTGP